MKKVDVNTVDNNGWTALHCAVDNAHFDICEELLKSKAININIKNNV